ncbi:MAG: IS200/IS605 family transposase [Desulfuromonadaceae bacterium]|nr:IS200/IS605 family transposase [Geobacteraceae bacterium]
MASTLTNLVYHVVFSTKGREPMIVASICDELYRYIGGIVKNEGGILIQIGGMPDHLHLVVKLKPNHQLSQIMQKIKGNSSKWINTQGQLKDRFSWQDGYGAFTVSESQVPIVVRYVKEQKNHHRKYSFKEELTQILELHNVEYEKRYLWT